MPRKTTAPRKKQTTLGRAESGVVAARGKGQVRPNTTESTVSADVNPQPGGGGGEDSQPAVRRSTRTRRSSRTGPQTRRKRGAPAPPVPDQAEDADYEDDDQEKDDSDKDVQAADLESDGTGSDEHLPLRAVLDAAKTSAASVAVKSPKDPETTYPKANESSREHVDSDDTEDDAIFPVKDNSPSAPSSEVVEVERPEPRTRQSDVDGRSSQRTGNKRSM